MKVYSDTLTTADLYDAARGVCDVWVCDVITRPKKRRNGWTVSLSGSSPYRSQVAGGHRAATWTEHGVWMDRLFDKDPHMVIATYDGRDDFIEQTQEAVNWVTQAATLSYYQDNPRELAKQQKRYSAPWLTA